MLGEFHRLAGLSQRSRFCDKNQDAQSIESRVHRHRMLCSRLDRGRYALSGVVRACADEELDYFQALPFAELRFEEEVPDANDG